MTKKKKAAFARRREGFRNCNPGRQHMMRRPRGQCLTVDEQAVESRKGIDDLADFPWMSTVVILSDTLKGTLIN